MIIQCTNDTWSVVSVLQSVLHEMVHRDLGVELSDEQFSQIEVMEQQLAAMLQEVR